MVSAAVRDLAHRRANSISIRNFTHLTYHAHMGFFKAFGVDHGNAPGEARGSGSYLPITIQDVVEIQREAVRGGMAVGEVVEQYARSLALVLARNEQENLTDMFTYSLREIMRNSVEHSQSSIIEYCAQYWPTQDRAEIAILDRGIGVLATLKRNPHLEIESNRHALNLSLLPGVSGKCYPGSKQRGADEWQNSGYGLYMTSRMCRNGGEFFIGSHDAGVLLKGSEKNYLAFSFHGTVVRMVFRPSAIGTIRGALKQYDAEGSELARTLRGTMVTASAASRMLATDFKSSASNSAETNK